MVPVNGQPRGGACGGVRFHGLFVGIDRCRDGRVPWLAGARDARALHALFGDALGNASSRLLTDDRATAEAMRRELKRLSNDAADDDVVVAFYAGHGSDDHRLVTFDADGGRLSASKHDEVRYFDIELDEEQLLSWIEQATTLPG